MIETGDVELRRNQTLATIKQDVTATSVVPCQYGY